MRIGIVGLGVVGSAIKTGFEKLAQVTTKSLNKVYTDFKIKEKKELKFKEEQVKKEQEKIISKDRELRKKEE